MSELFEQTESDVLKVTPEQYAAMSPEEKASVDQKVKEMQAEVAEGLLRSPKGWDIAQELYGQALKRVLFTSQFVVPTLQHREAILLKLTDPTGFQKSFQTLCSDLDLCTRTLRTIGKKHEGKQGTPSDEEVPFLFSICNEYHEVLTVFETTIDPLLYSLIDVVQTQYGDMDQETQA